MSNALVKLSGFVSPWRYTVIADCNQMTCQFVLRVTFLHLNNITSYYSKQKEVIQERSSVVIGSVCPVRNSPEASVLSLLAAAVVPVLLENTPSHLTWSLQFGLYFSTMKTLSRVVVARLVWRDKNFGLHMPQCADVVPQEGSTHTIFECFLWRTFFFWTFEFL